LSDSVALSSKRKKRRRRREKDEQIENEVQNKMENRASAYEEVKRAEHHRTRPYTNNAMRMKEMRRAARRNGMR
jgi:hypothetical protein